MLKVTQQLKINEEYLKKVPRPEPEQYKALKESIKENGQLEPIIVNRDYEIIDGYTRFQICQELKIEPKFQIRKFDDRNAESLFVRTVNQKRRHLTTLQIYEMYQDEIEEIRQQNVTKRNQDIWKTRNDEKESNTPRQKYENSTQYKVHQLTGIGRGQYEAITFLKEHADETMLEKIRKKEVGLFEAYHKIRKTDHKRRDFGKVYRSKFGIIFDVLLKINESPQSMLKVSGVSTHANLSHYAAVEILNPLIKHQFIDTKKQDGFLYYKLTGKGLTYLQSCKELLKLLPDELRVTV